MEIHLLFFFIIAPTIVLKKASCLCTVPAAFISMNADTLSSSPVDFSDSTNIIWKINIHGVTFPWRCEDTGPDDLLFLRSKAQVSSFPVNLFFYVCLQFKTVSDATLYYYLLNDKNVESNVNARIYESTNGFLKMCDVCEQSAVGSNDYNVMSSTGTADKSVISNPSLGADPCAPTTTSIPTTITSTAAATTTETSTTAATTTETSTTAATTTETSTTAATTTETSSTAATTTETSTTAATTTETSTTAATTTETSTAAATTTEMPTAAATTTEMSTAAATTTETSTAAATKTESSTAATTTTETPTTAATTTETSMTLTTTTLEQTSSQTTSTTTLASTSSEPITTTSSSATIESCRSTQDNNACSFEGLDKTLQKEYEMDKNDVCMSSCKTTNMKNNLKEGIIGIRMENVRTRGKRDTANVYFFVCILFKQTQTSYNMYYWTDKGSNGTLRYVESTKSNLTLCEICDPKIIPNYSECESIQTDGTSSGCVNLTEDTDPRYLAPQCSSRSSSQEIGLIVVAVSVTVSLVLIGLALIVIFISLENRRKYLLKPNREMSKDKLRNYELKSS